VVQFKPPFNNGMNASLVIGQRDFVTKAASIGKSGMNLPQGLALDPAGNLWVVDLFNNRVLEFQPPFSTGMGASLVIGQQNFTTNIQTTTQNGLSDPVKPAFDSFGNLWVTEFGNHRILEFSSTPVPEFPIASLAIVALVSLAVVVVVARRFSLRRADL
jgi:DNA-binding beta-propeller fold protein YncE